VLPVLGGVVVAAAVATTGSAAALPTVLALLAELAGAATLGTLLLHTLTTGPTVAGRPPRATAVASAAWVLLSLVLAGLEPGTRGYWLFAAVLGAAVGVGALSTRAWTSAALLTGLAGAGVVAGPLAGPVAVGVGSDLGSSAVVLLTLAGAAWSGVLLAALAAPEVTVAMPVTTADAAGVVSAASTALRDARCRAVGLGAAPVLALAGTVLLVQHAGTTPVVALATALAAGALALAAVLAPTGRRPGPRVTLVALVLGAGAVAAALARTPVQDGTPAARVLGYPLPGRPTVAALVGDWRFDIVLGSAALLLAAAYLLGVRTMTRRGDRWPPGRTAAWLAGCLVLLLTTSSGVGAYSRGMFSVYMVLHMSLSMFAPVLLVLGGPVTLALRTLPTHRGAAGPREWLLGLLHSRASRLLTNPLVAIVVFLVTLYGVYFTAVFTTAQQHPWGYELLNIHFLVSGYLFYYGIIGIDPGPERPPFLARLGVLFAVMPFHAFFGIAIISTSGIIGEGFYRTLALPWVGDLLSDQHTGGAIAWVSGEVPLILVTVSLLAQWARQDERTAVRTDRRADADGDTELQAYNTMLEQLARGRR
jgi:cytochrome c oxidase assembly factor CtaG